jgi:hypothetical protein
MLSDMTRFDLSLLLIWIIAVLIVVLGALWTDYEFVKRFVGFLGCDKMKSIRFIKFCKIRTE